MKRTLISIIAVISTALIFTACGNIEDDSKAEPKVTAADSSIVDSTADTTTSIESVTTTSISSADDSSSRVTTTTIVSGKDKSGKITTLIIGEGGKILSTSPNNKTTTKTTTKTTAKTTTKQVGSNNKNSNQNNGGNNNNSYSYNNNQNNYQPNSSGGNNGNQNSGGNNSPAPVQTNPPQTQTERKTTTTTQKPVTTTTTTTAQPQNVSIDTADLDDTLKAYLHFDNGDTLSDNEFELIRQDICNYALEKFNGKTTVECRRGNEHYSDSDTISFAAPLNLSVNTSWTDFSHAHYDGSAGPDDRHWEIAAASTNAELYNIAVNIQNSTRSVIDAGIFHYWGVCYNEGYLDDPILAPLCSELQFNIGIDDGWLWFLTE